MHASIDVLRGLGLNLPASQLVHAADTALLHAPAAQSVHEGDPALLHVPAAQDAHASMDVLRGLGLNLPASQLVH
jgi:hypothetical protein